MIWLMLLYCIPNFLSLEREIIIIIDFKVFFLFFLLDMQLPDDEDDNEEHALWVKDISNNENTGTSDYDPQ